MPLVVASGSKLHGWQPPVSEDLFDDFDGVAVDEDKFLVYDRDGDRVAGDENCVRPANATVAGSVLTITSEYVPAGITASDSADGPREVFYASAQVVTKQSWTYGTFEARVRTSGGTGLWPLFWLLGDGWKASQPTTANVAGHNWPADTGGWWEIDIMEFLAGTRVENNCAAHVNSSSTAGAGLPFNANTRFMVYRLVWQPTYLRWYVDAEDGNGYVLLRELTDTGHIPTTPGYLQMHAAVGGYSGTPTPGDFPLTTEFDWVRVTQ